MTNASEDQVVVIRAGGERRPLFLIEEGSGGGPAVERLSSLLDADLPIHGIRVGQDDTRRGVSVQELAARHVSLIQRVQAEGPYRLAGWRSGGALAYEIAYQLLGRDQVVEFVGLIDSPVPGRQSAALPIPLHSFTAEPEMETLAAALSRCLAQAESVPPPILEPHKASVSIQSGPNAAITVFCVPGAGANVTSFLALADVLGSACNVIGLCARGHDSGSIPHTSVEAAARAYLRDVRAIEPRGPYYLLGHSFGGWIAFEMARQLSAAGERVAPVVLIDTETPHASPWSNRLQVLRRFMDVIEIDIGRSLQLRPEVLMGMDEQAQVERLLRQLIAAKVLPPRTRLDTLSQIVRVFEAHLNTSYIPASRWDGLALLINAEQQLDEEQSSTTATWSDYASEVSTVTLGGSNHFSMLKEPHVSGLVAEIARVWTALR